MPYRAPITDFEYIYNNVIDLAQVGETEKFSDIDSDTVSAILTEAGRLAEEVLYPVNRNGDLTPAMLENGKVRSSPGFAEAFKAIGDGGWVSTSSDPEYGGMGLPFSVTMAVSEMMSSGCLALQLNPLLTMGHIEALEAHASDEIKQTYLPKLNSGQWSGTMNLTEPQAGSDVGALATKAERNDDGSYAITGQKIFITWGDTDFCDNVCHLVLARLPDGGKGTKGISLFMVPRNIPDQNGEAGVANSLKVVSLEHKLGIHGSPTAVMQYDGATGWLVGQEHDGMKCMFTMMNNARLSVGGQGVGMAEAAYQHALAYATERKQGRTPVENGTGTISEHADVRRMLVTMKAEIFAARAIALDCAVAIDMSHGTKSAEWKTRAAFLTPIAKSFGTDVGIRTADAGVQIHGGMGFIEETGAAQYARDVRITSIYEGTNGIQSMDLVARKLMDGGEMANALIDEIESFAEEARATRPRMAESVWQASETLREATEWMVGQGDLNERFAGSVPYLNGFARILGAHYHLKAACAEGENGPRTKLARFYINRLLPEHTGLLAHAMQGAEDLYAMNLDDLSK
ncbi:acyl-CoA dehydrogenase [Cognatishimia sp. 1_MG-2023]|uniref:acyl-CoA dehydrogenase n=1 Tax=Cognatishimia sp. 1_MG-2023 TaxID=3062642 RepID=UPI0026E3B6BF|nr:acyl-CoA dehydrogenase [Cognatishimia sp. 1_MG-2023]MDO6726096.1 acyl-CoA dehydrogenase [Cognatishimia sp. 1_MG-2023]